MYTKCITDLFMHTKGISYDGGPQTNEAETQLSQGFSKNTFHLYMLRSPSLYGLCACNACILSQHAMLSFQHITVRCFIAHDEKKTIHNNRLMTHCFLTRKALCNYKLDSF